MCMCITSFVFFQKFYMLDIIRDFWLIYINVFTQADKNNLEPLNWIFPSNRPLTVLIAAHITDLIERSIVLASLIKQSISAQVQYL